MHCPVQVDFPSSVALLDGVSSLCVSSPLREFPGGRANLAQRLGLLVAKCLRFAATLGTERFFAGGEYLCPQPRMGNDSGRLAGPVPVARFGGTCTGDYRSRHAPVAG